LFVGIHRSKERGARKEEWEWIKERIIRIMNRGGADRRRGE